MGDNDICIEIDNCIDMSLMEVCQCCFEEDFVDVYDEEFEMEFDDCCFDDGEDLLFLFECCEVCKEYFCELFCLQGEFVKLQDWVVYIGYWFVVIFEGCDVVGKGGVIKCIMQCLNLCVCWVVVLFVLNNCECMQWYFQCYVVYLLVGGEIVLFDCSWYNCVGVECVMNFCIDDEYEEFFWLVFEFEKMLVCSGIQIVKYWFLIIDYEQELCFQSCIEDLLKQWKLSLMDFESCCCWEVYMVVKEEMLQCMYIFEVLWWVVQVVDKKCVWLNCIYYLFGQVLYYEVLCLMIDLLQCEYYEDYICWLVLDNMIVLDVY